MTASTSSHQEVPPPSDENVRAAKTIVEASIEQSPVAVAAEAASTTVGAQEPPTSSSYDVREAQMQINRSIKRLLTVLVVGGGLYTCYLASDLILPILLAVFFALLLSPAMKRLSRGWLPRWIGALLLVTAFLAVLVGIGNALYPSASQWVGRAPQVLRDATPKLKALVRPFKEASKMTESLGDITGDGKTSNQRIVDVSATKSLLSATPRVFASALAVVLLTYFFLIYSDTVLRKILTLRPTWEQKRLTVDIVRAIQSDLSRYVMTICATSMGLGIATATLLWALDVETPILWGAMAALLNLTPYVGPLVMASMLALVGLSQFPTLAAAFLPASGYLGLHLIEGQFATPLALGRTISINPLAIILWLLIWGWLWGILGLLLAVPMLVCVKIVCSRVDGLRGFAVLIEK
ncbi:MAG: AI-2E family transporter [Dokdonella sp.]